MTMSIPVARLNHAVLFVRDATSVGRVLRPRLRVRGRRERVRRPGRVHAPPNGDNHHDLGLFSVGPDAPRPPRGSVGLYHLAWEVPTIEDLAAAARSCPRRARSAARPTTA